MLITLEILVAVAAGVFAGLTGGGGGLIIVPMLVLLNYSALDAVATSNIAIFISAVAGTVTNARRTEMPWRRVGLLALPAILLAPLGAYVAFWVPSVILVLGLVVLNVANILLIEKRRRAVEQPGGRQGQVPMKTVVVGGSAGLLAGTFGVGGGLIMVPLQVSWLATPIQVAARISLAVIAFSSIGAILGHVAAGDDALQWDVGLVLGIGSLIGAPVGAIILRRISQNLATRIFQATLVVLTVVLVLQTAGRY